MLSADVEFYDTFHVYIFDRKKNLKYFLTFFLNESRYKLLHCQVNPQIGINNI